MKLKNDNIKLIWFVQATPENLNSLSRNTMVEHVGIEFLEVGSDY
jgi:hypothetical protein